MQQVQATAKFLRISPRKLRLVVDQVRTLPVVKAESILQYMNKKGGRLVLKVLQSAVANAEHNEHLQKEDLVIKSIVVNEGFTIKRYRPRAFGRAAMIRKRTSHVSITLEGTVRKKEKNKEVVKQEKIKEDKSVMTEQKEKVVTATKKEENIKKKSDQTVATEKQTNSDKE